MPPELTPSKSQRDAIEAEPVPQLVIAGPGAGKTFCLIERIRHLIERRGVAPERIYAFTFTNKAAEEVASRLDRLGAAAQHVKRTTLHRFCVDLLREFGDRVGVDRGFGIADEEYQLSVMWRLEANPRKHKGLLAAFALHRLRGDPLSGKFLRAFEKYNAILREHHLLDFDQLIVKAADLVQHTELAATIRARWGAILVDEFQDLNRVQYAIVKALASDHRNVFAVGDFDQSIYGWAGADTSVFQAYMNDFGITAPIALKENRRCPTQVFALARKLVSANAPLLEGLQQITADKQSPFDVEAVAFDEHDAEVAWIIRDIERQRREFGLALGDFALLYRKHEIGDVAEPALLSAGLPCRLAHGRAIAEDPVVAYVAAALRVIANPGDAILQETFLGLVLPKTLMHAVKAAAEASSQAPIDLLRRRWRDRDEDGRKIRRGLYALKNFGAVGRRHTQLGDLVEELLSQRVGEYRTPLEREHHRISDPETIPEAMALAFRLSGAIKHERAVSIPALGGAGIPLKAILHEIGVRTVYIGSKPKAQSPELIAESDGGAAGLPLTLFKAAQILASRKFAHTFRDFVAVDLETTGKDIRSCEVVEVGAVRVRDGTVVAEFHERVRPRIPIEPGATATHGLREADVAAAPYFEDVWPRLRDFCGNDMLVAHNGFRFDFPIIKRMAAGLPGVTGLSTYDTLPLAKELYPDSKALENLARKFGIDTGRSHSAIDDSRALAKVFVKLSEAKLSLTRKACLVSVLDHLGVALALSGPYSEDSEAKVLLDIARSYAFGAHSECLSYYATIRDELGDPKLPDVDAVIDALGGRERMLRIQAEKSADERYPVAMQRIRRLIAGVDGALGDQIATFLERVALSLQDGQTPDHDRVNLLTLHSTKGLEFSRVYIVGVEDAQFLGDRTTKPELEESRRVLYVGMTRAKDRLVLTRCVARGGKPTGGSQFLDEMGLTSKRP